MVTAAWSHLGNQVVFGDASGSLWLQDARGQSRLVGSSLPADEWAQNSIYLWSPDDSRLLVSRAGRAWIVDVGR
jgi:hypothetical protein